MCRWLAYSGDPIFLDQLVTRPAHSIVEQSFDTTMNYKNDGSLWAMNGDGFGVGWYDRKGEPGIFKDKMPAWNDENLHEICSQTEANIFFAHIRASTNGAVQRTNSHPFKHKNWLFQHNGDVGHFSKIKRALQYDVHPDLFTDITGTTDSETCFYLALTYGLMDDPKPALEKMIKRLEQVQEDAGYEAELNLSFAISDGEKIYTIRYASGKSLIKSQFYSTDMSCVEDISGACTALPSNGVILVSEPLDNYSDKWISTPPNSFVCVHQSQVEIDLLSL